MWAVVGHFTLVYMENITEKEKEKMTTIKMQFHSKQQNLLFRVKLWNIGIKYDLQVILCITYMYEHFKFP